MRFELEYGNDEREIVVGRLLGHWFLVFLIYFLRFFSKEKEKRKKKN